MKPNFIIIGAARSGTTSLFKYLEQHPDIFMPEIKEINYFSNERYWRKGVDWYERHFSNANNNRVGEASTSYTSYPNLPNSAERIFKYRPDMKLIYVLRDPIDRLTSHYLHRISRAVESREITDIINNHSDDFLLTQGKYHLQLKQYYQYFAKESIHLLTVEDLKNRPAESMKSIYQFLKIDPSIAESQKLDRYNANNKVTRKSEFGKRILSFYHNHIEQVAYPYRAKKLFLRAAEIGAKEVKPPKLSAEDLETLIRYYRDDIVQLKKDTNVDISLWREYL